MKKSSKSERAILAAAYEVLARDMSAPMTEVAAAAQVGRATLHRHFRTRDDLLTALTHHALAELDHAINAAIEGAPTHIEALRLAMAAAIPLADKQLFLSRQTAAQAALVAQADSESLAETRDAIEAAKAEGSLPGAVPTPWIARHYEALIYIAWDSIMAQELTPTQASAYAWKSFLSAMEGGPDDTYGA